MRKLTQAMRKAMRKAVLDNTDREVDAGHAIQDYEYIGVCQPTETKVEADWKEKDEQLEIKIEGGPRGRLMLRHRGYNGYVILGIGRVQQ